MAILAGTVLAVAAGCGTTVEGTPWPEGQGPAVPAGVAVPGDSGGRSEPSEEAAGPPTSFTEPVPLTEAPPELPTTTTSPGSPAPSPGTSTPPPAPSAGGSGSGGTGSEGPAPGGSDSGGSGSGSGPRPDAEPTRTIAPVPVAPTSEVPDGRPRPAPGPADRADRAEPPAPATERAGPAPLTADVLADECLLPTGPLTGLLGAAPAAPPANAEVRRAGGGAARSCFAVGGTSSVSVNVYVTNLTTPAGYVRAAPGARRIDGTGEGTAAVLLETVGGPTLQLGTRDRLVTVAVAGRTPTDAQWRAAATAAVATLAAR